MMVMSPARVQQDFNPLSQCVMQMERRQKTAIRWALTWVSVAIAYSLATNAGMVVWIDPRCGSFVCNHRLQRQMELASRQAASHAS